MYKRQRIKTTVSAAFIRLSQAKAVADCDVDAPNLHLVMEQKAVPQTCLLYTSILWYFFAKYSKIKRNAAGECLMVKKTKKIWQITGAVLLLGASFGGMAAARNIDGFADWYGANIYPLLAGVLGRISGLMSFSLVETGLYLSLIHI